MRVKFDEQLRELNSEMIQMGNRIKKAIRDINAVVFRRGTDDGRNRAEE